MSELGNLKILNHSEDLAPGTESSFTFTVPPGGDGELREATYKLRRSEPLMGDPADPWISNDIIIKSLEVVKKGASERANLLSGTPNIDEFGGNGRLTRLFTIIETCENNEDIVVLVRNDDSVEVNVSLTVTLAVKTKKREIAAQPR